MSFLESPRFPDCVAFGASGGPGFMTDIVVVQGGTEYRNQVRSLELGRWEVSHAARRPAEYKPLQKFFRLAAGRANGFRFKDHLDYRCTANVDGVFTQLTPTTFQMWKRYDLGGSENYLRKLQKIVSGTVTVTGGTGATVDLQTGIVTVASGTPTTFACEFDVPCRFDTDQMVATTVTRASDGELLVTWDSIPLVEIRV